MPDTRLLADPNDEPMAELVEEVLKEATRQGASSACATVGAGSGLSVTVRMGEVETVEHHRSKSLGVTVYFGQRTGSSSSTDLEPAAIKDTVSAACRIARFTEADDCAGLADADLMASEPLDLDLFHPWELEAERAAELALRRKPRPARLIPGSPIRKGPASAPIRAVTFTATPMGLSAAMPAPGTA